MRRRVFSILFCAIAACGDFDGYKLATTPDGGTTEDPSATIPIEEPEAPSAGEVCGPTGCATSCPSTLRKCGQACVDTQSDAQHCGVCNAGCPAPMNGSASCAGGACKAQCNNGYRLCGASCVAESPTSCGATCKVCPSTANGTPQCTSGTCSIKCNAGYQACATGCCLIAPVCKPSGASCGNRADCCNDICFASTCLCMKPGQGCESDKQCCDGKKCGLFQGSPNTCIP